MNSKTMTIHEALAELKVLDRKIEKRIAETRFAEANRHSNQKIDGKSLADFVSESEKALQSILDLLNYRKAIRNALSQSNALTKITVAGKEYTVAEAIEMKKTGFTLYRDLGFAINSQLQTAKRKCDSSNAGLDKKADDYVSNLIGSKEKADLEKASDIREQYVVSNTYEVVAMPNLVEITSTIIEDVDKFFSEVDAKISISNALTVITAEW